MRNPFKKTVPSTPQTGDSTAEIFSLDEAMASVSADAPDPIDSKLSREARQGAAQLIGSVREILVGEHIRSMDGRFFALQSALEEHYSQLVTSLTSELRDVEISTGARLDELEDGLSVHRDELQAQDEKVLSEIEVSNTRSIALEEKLASAISASENEDNRIGTALAEGLEHLQAMESRLQEKTNLLDQQQAEAQQAIAANTARMVELEDQVVAVVESLHQHDAKILENLQALSARVDEIEEDVGGQLDKLRHREVEARNDLTAAATRVDGLEANAESLNEGMRDQMRQITEYFTRQVGELGREIIRQKEEVASQMVTRSDLSRLRAATPAPSPAPKPVSTPASNGGKGTNSGNGVARPQRPVKTQPREIAAPSATVAAPRNEVTPSADSEVKVTLGDFAPFPRVDLGPKG